MVIMVDDEDREINSNFGKDYINEPVEGNTVQSILKEIKKG